eukprot:1896172-Alexandrium_andersonii.AAC.1
MVIPPSPRDIHLYKAQPSSPISPREGGGEGQKPFNSCAGIVQRRRCGHHVRRSRAAKEVRSSCAEEQGIVWGGGLTAMCRGVGHCLWSSGLL